jgi:hypothetical protein
LPARVFPVWARRYESWAKPKSMKGATLLLFSPERRKESEKPGPLAKHGRPAPQSTSVALDCQGKIT